MQDFLPFALEQLSAVPTALSTKRVGITSIGSGVYLPQALLAAMPVKPDHSHHPQPYLRLPTSRTESLPISLRRPLIPFQQFFNNRTIVVNS